MTATDDTTHFGFDTVRLGEKQARVDDVFHSVARRYDLMNDLMSAGLHRVWKANLVSMLRVPRRRPFRHLDVAGGTGDVAFRVAEAGGRQTRVTVADINTEMLAGGRGSPPQPGPQHIDFVGGKAPGTPLRGGPNDGHTT